MSKPIRLFVDCHVFDGGYHGVRSVIKGLYGHLIQQADDIEFFMAAHDIENLKKEFPTGKRVHYIQFNSPSSYWRLAVDIPRLITAHKIDYSHFQYVCPPIKRGRYIVTIHDILFREFPEMFPLSYRISKGALFRWSANRADILTTGMVYSQGSLVRHFGIGESRIKIVPYAVPDRYFQPVDKPESQRLVEENHKLGKYILYISRVEPRKNHHRLVAAFEASGLWRQGYKLVLVGFSSVSYPEYDRAIADLPPECGQAIILLEHIGEEEIIHLFKAAELFVYPSMGEGGGLPPLEAAALEVPVICSNTTAMEEYDFFGKGHFDPADQEKLTRLLVEGVSESFRAPQRLAEIKRVVQERYSWSKSAQVLHKLIVEDNGRRSGP
ncbi:MAG: glycosyltransferase family 4 protein [Nitrospinota bacterium]|nr:glycosyltransferase family 4 protein [Nitrospinota bacterium]